MRRARYYRRPRDSSGADRTTAQTMMKPRLIAAAEIDRLETWAKYTADTVSYTHLTLPTSDLV